MDPLNELRPDESLGRGNEEDPGKSVSLKRRAWVMICLLILLILVGVNLAISSGKVQMEKVISGSMEPTLQIGDVILSDAGALPCKYDIICLNDPEDPKGKLVKRIVAESDDLVVVDGGILYINGHEEYSEQVTANSLNVSNKRVKVPLDHVFVMGDNRNNSHDSLDFGPVPCNQIRGVVSYIIWPPRALGQTQAVALMVRLLFWSATTWRRFSESPTFFQSLPDLSKYLAADFSDASSVFWATIYTLEKQRQVAALQNIISPLLVL